MISEMENLRDNFSDPDSAPPDFPSDKLLGEIKSLARQLASKCEMALAHTNCRPDCNTMSFEDGWQACEDLIGLADDVMALHDDYEAMIEDWMT